MPIVNVYAKKTIRGLRRPFVGNKKNINLTEDEIRICKLYGATVEYVGAQPAKVEVAPVVEPTKVVEPVAPQEPEPTPVEEVVEEVQEPEVPEEVVDETPEETAPAEDEAPVEEVEKVNQSKNSGKKKNK